MLNPAKCLSGSIVDQFPEKLANKMPAEMPKTGMGGTADKNLSFEMLLAGLFAAAGVTAMVIRRKVRQN